MASTLAGKRAMVTGGGRGIGAAIAQRLVSQGAVVAIDYRSAPNAHVGELRDHGRAASTFPGDISDADPPAGRRGGIRV